MSLMQTLATPQSMLKIGWMNMVFLLFHQQRFAYYIFDIEENRSGTLESRISAYAGHLLRVFIPEKYFNAVYKYYCTTKRV